MVAFVISYGLQFLLHVRYVCPHVIDPFLDLSCCLGILLLHLFVDHAAGAWSLLCPGYGYRGPPCVCLLSAVKQ